ncbi:MAG: hypothetical protein IPJ98_29450 [Bryobacterales bacterium]|nr:hypothetical protein [Bryobacterales bacterium]
MSLSTAPIETIEQRTERLVLQHNAKGDLERHFCRDMASSQVTAESYERLIFKLGDADDPDDRRIGRIQLAKSRALNDGHKALRALMDVQDRRNLIERFPDQTNDCPSSPITPPSSANSPKSNPFLPSSAAPWPTPPTTPSATPSNTPKTRNSTRSSTAPSPQPLPKGPQATQPHPQTP